MQRFGQVIKIKPEKLEHYKYLHANQWPQVRDMLTQCHIHNYTMFEKSGLLFSNFEYTGNDYEVDMLVMAADPIIAKWGAECRLCQEPVDPPTSEDWWVKWKKFSIRIRGRVKIPQLKQRSSRFFNHLTS